MVSTYTPNLQLEEPARGDYVGTWDTPVNNNMTLLDKVAGGVTAINLNNSNVVLSNSQFQSKTITFQSTLTGSIAITFPTSFTKSYEIQNICTGSSAFTITLQTTVSGGQVISIPFGEIFDCINDGTNIKFKNFGRVGSYWDFAGSSVPAWVSGCTVPPYLNCDGTSFSSATYPQLAVVLGGTTLPDSKGRTRFAMDQGAARISSGSVGFSSGTFGVGAGGGNQSTTLGTSNLPAYTPTGTVTVTNTGALYGANGYLQTTGGAQNVLGTAVSIASSATFSGTAQGGLSAPLTNLPPAYIGGITMIRSA